jgi:hypothetical protein
MRWKSDRYKAGQSVPLSDYINRRHRTKLFLITLIRSGLFIIIFFHSPGILSLPIVLPRWLYDFKHRSSGWRGSGCARQDKNRTTIFHKNLTLHKSVLIWVFFVYVTGV